MAVISLAQMDTGGSGKVVNVAGGRGLIRRLDAMGLRPGKMVTKCSGMFMRGPVVVRVEGTQMAVGYGMAGKILVDTGLGENL